MWSCKQGKAMHNARVRLVAQWAGRFAESAKLDGKMSKNLSEVSYEI